MASENDFIWNVPAFVAPPVPAHTKRSGPYEITQLRPSYVRYSPRSGGWHRLADGFSPPHDLSNETRCKLAHYIAKKNLEFGTMPEAGHVSVPNKRDLSVSEDGFVSIPDEKIPLIDQDLIDKIEKEPFPNRVERIDYPLLFYEKIKDKNSDAFDTLFNASSIPKYQILAALMFCDNESQRVGDLGDFKNILAFAVEMKVLSAKENEDRSLNSVSNNVLISVKITPKGYDRFIELQSHPPDSKQAFIAMWFDEETNDIYKNGILPAIEQARFIPFRIDQKEHNDFIDDQIIVEIKKSKFLVADFTSALMEDGAIARGGVYWEAGFATGLDIPVIYTCREDVLDHIHFDIRHRNFITWNTTNMDEFVQNLKNRILATI